MLNVTVFQGTPHCNHAHLSLSFDFGLFIRKMPNPTIRQILKKVSSYGVKLSLIEPQNKRNLNTNVTSLNLPASAKQGELSWVSSANLKSFQAASFKGSLLVGPLNFKASTSPSSAFILAENPKLVFSKIVQDFFKHLTEIHFPGMEDSPVDDDAEISNNVLLAKGVVIGQGVVLHKNISIGPNTILANCEIGENTVIGANCSIGFPGFGYTKDIDGSYVQFPHVGRVIIGKNVRIGSNTCIDRGGLGNTVIADGVKIDNLVHIAHNVRIGKNSIIIANTMIGGSTVIGDNVWVAPSAALLNKLKVEDGAIIGMGAVVLKNVKRNTVVVGNPGRVIRKNKLT